MMERIVWSAIGLRKAFEFIMTSRTTMDYRNKYLHASVCESGNGCSRSCTKWKLFIHHLQNCPVGIIILCHF